jgi:hypothetical protein
MNNCKFTEEETTAAVYSYLGLQNPKLLPAIGAPAELPPPAPVMETVLKKSAVTADTKKVSRVTTGKKGLVGPIAAGVVKTAGSKGADGTLKRKSLNDVGVDISADEIAYARILADKNKLKEKEKNKRQRTSEGFSLLSFTTFNRFGAGFPASSCVLCAHISSAFGNLTESQDAGFCIIVCPKF